MFIDILSVFCCFFTQFLAKLKPQPSYSH